MAIFRTSNAVEFDDVDGIIVDERAPAANVQGVPANIAILVAQFQRGPSELSDTLAGIADFHEKYGKSSFSGNKEIKNKKFGSLKIIRVAAADGVKGTLVLVDDDATPETSLTINAKDKGLYGNSLTVTVEDGSVQGKKYTFIDTNLNAVIGAEVFDNVILTGKTQEDVDLIFVTSLLIDAVLPVSPIDQEEPVNIAATPLAAGSDGTVIDTDYETAIAFAEAQRAGNVMWLDLYNTARRGFLKIHAANTQDKMVIVAGDNPKTETRSAAVALVDSESLRDTAGRIIYVFAGANTRIDGLVKTQSAASWMASIISQTSPHIDPAFAGNLDFLAGIVSLEQTLTRADYIALKNAGISALEQDSDLGGHKFKSGIVTQILNSSKLTILRRRMTDFLTDSAAIFLKNSQNDVNSLPNRTAVKGAILSFVQVLETSSILPKDSEVKTGKAKLVDTNALNSDNSVAAGFFKVLWKQRIFSSMRFIVLQAEIGESVVVTEGE